MKPAMVAELLVQCEPELRNEGGAAPAGPEAFRVSERIDAPSGCRAQIASQDETVLLRQIGVVVAQVEIEILMSESHARIANSLPAVMASALQPEQLELMRLRLLQIPEPALPQLKRSDWLGALGICVLCFISTFPIAIPFIFIGDVKLALRVSNAVAIAMLFLHRPGTATL